jgi:aspartate racemase
MLTAYAHQDLPFEEILRALEREHDRQRTALSQVLVIWHNAMLWPLHYATPTLSFETLEQSVVAPEVALTTFDIILTLRESPQGLTVVCLYKTDLFEATTISQMLDDFQDMLRYLSTQSEQRLAILRSLQGTHNRS